MVMCAPFSLKDEGGQVHRSSVRTPEAPPVPGRSQETRGASSGSCSIPPSPVTLLATGRISPPGFVFTAVGFGLRYGGFVGEPVGTPKMCCHDLRPPPPGFTVGEDRSAAVRLGVVQARHDLGVPAGDGNRPYTALLPGLRIFPVHPRWMRTYIAYNELKSSPLIYAALQDEYRFMLCHEPDAFVFRDEVEQWCDSGFDYIGAPWFSGRPDTPTTPTSSASATVASHCATMMPTCGRIGP